MIYQIAPPQRRVFILLLIIITAFSTLTMLFRQAEAMAPPVVTAVMPNQAQQGDTGVVIRMEISDIPPVTPLTVTIGMEQGTNIEYKDFGDTTGAVTATFDFPAMMPTQSYTVAVAFPGPMGQPPVVAESTAGSRFEIIAPAPDSCFTTYGANTTTQFSSADGTAVQAAVDAAAADDTVKIAGTCTGVQEISGVTQTVHIVKNITLQGGYTETDWTAAPDPETYPTTLDADNSGRVALISGTITVTIDSLILQNGLALDNDTPASGSGGGLYIQNSTVTITNSALLNNMAEFDGGALHNDLGTANIVNSTLSNNTADEGGGLNNANGVVTLTNAMIISNTAINNGGAIFNRSNNAHITIASSTIAYNQAGSNLVFDPPTADLLAPQNFDDGGGGIYNLNATVIITNSTITNNTVTGTGGGGLAQSDGGTIQVANTTLSHNIANGGQGGGLLINNGTAVFTNTTVSGNTAETGGAIYVFDIGAVTLNYATIASNTASLNGQNIALSDINTSLAFNSSLITHNSGTNCYITAGTIIDNGYNLDSGTSCGLTQTTSITNTNPLLEPLADNGGDTETHALSSNSAALNHIPTGTNSCGTDVTADQRGTTRPQEGSCEIGAYEATPPSLCFVEFGNDADTLTDFSSVDGSAIQEAINAAVSGDMLHIAGTCTGVVNTNSTNQTAYISKTLTLIGGYSSTWVYDPDTYTTTLDADDSGRVLYSTGDIDIELTHLTLQNGSINNHGGGIYNHTAALTLTNVTVQNNHTQQGSTFQNGWGIYNETGRLTIVESTIQNNETSYGMVIPSSVSSGNGGGIYTSGPTSIISSTIAFNKTGDPGTVPFGDGGNTGSGGGIYATAPLVITASMIHDNFISSAVDAVPPPFGDGTSGGHSGDGGGIYTSISLILTNSQVTQNSIGDGGNGTTPFDMDIAFNGGDGGNAGFGGGIYIAGLAIMENSQILSNTTGTGGSRGFGVSGGTNGTDGQDGAGAGIYSEGSVNSTSDIISGNQSVGGGGGIYISNNPFSATGSTIANNAASAANGGGLYADGASVNLDNVTIDGNSVPIENEYDGGGINTTNGTTLTIDNSEITNNIANSGGGIVLSHENDVVTITHSLISGNAADHVDAFGRAPSNNFGGGILNYNGTLTIQDSTISHNSVSGTGGGGVSNGSDGGIDAVTTISNTTIVNNTAETGSGGGLYNGGQTLTIVNSTFSGNTASTAGGVYYTYHNPSISSTATIAYSTIASNTASINGANLMVSGQNATLTTTASIVAGSSTGCYILNDGTLVDGGYNIDSGSSCGFTHTTSLSQSNPLLEPLMDNGGDTATQAIPTTSPAFDAIPNGTAGCGTTVTADQRGMARPQLDGCDIGAFEYDGVRYLLTVSKAGTGMGTITSTDSGINCGSDCSESYLEGTIITLTATADLGSTFTGWSGACSGTGICEVTLSMAQNVTATFALDVVPTYTLSVTKDGTGAGTVTSSPAGIECGSTCTADFDEDTLVTLTATADLGSTFNGWSGACSGTSSCAVTLSMAQTVNATFNVEETDLLIYLPMVIR